MYGKEVIIADRELVEENADEILEPATDSVVSFLVVGDPFGCVRSFAYVVFARLYA